MLPGLRLPGGRGSKKVGVLVPDLCDEGDTREEASGNGREAWMKAGGWAVDASAPTDGS